MFVCGFQLIDRNRVHVVNTGTLKNACDGFAGRHLSRQESVEESPDDEGRFALQ